MSATPFPRNPEAWRPPLVVLAGMGTGRECLAESVLAWIRRAEVLAGGSRLLEGFPGHSGDKLPLRAPLGESLEELARVSARRRTAVLASGDPFFFGVGKRLVELLGKDRLLTFPNLTTVQSLFARLAEPWEDVRVVSLHGRKGEGWLREARLHDRVAFFTDAERSPAWIARKLLEAGFGDRDLIVAEDLGAEGESIRRLSLESAAREAFSPLNLAVAMPGSRTPEGPLNDYPLLGLPEEALEHQGGLITKMEIRAAVLAHLCLKPGLVLWDLGAASGSVAIEAARLAPLDGVLAMEKDEIRYAHLAANVKRFRCGEIRAVHGDAARPPPDAPDPHRVFIGGGGPRLQAILEAVEKRLRRGGRVVQTAVTLDALEISRRFWQDRSFQVDVVQIQASRSVPIGNSQRLEALNPVFIVTAQDGGT